MGECVSFSSAGPGASTRIYYEARHPDGPESVSYERCMKWIDGPKYGFSTFPRDLTVLPDSWSRTLRDVVLLKRHERGGHFAATEMPEAVVGDLRSMFARGGGGAYGIIEGCEGY